MRNENKAASEQRHDSTDKYGMESRSAANAVIVKQAKRNHSSITAVV